MNWQVKRKEPYTSAGISRLKCVRCGESACYQWNICSDGSNYRPICKACDIALNEMLLRWFKHPNATALMAKYKARAISPSPAQQAIPAKPQPDQPAQEVDK